MVWEKLDQILLPSYQKTPTWLNWPNLNKSKVQKAVEKNNQNQTNQQKLVLTTDNQHEKNRQKESTWNIAHRYEALTFKENGLQKVE